MPSGFQRTQIGGGDGEHVGEFLRLRAAGIVDHAAVGGREWPAKSLRRQIGNDGVEDRRERVPGQRAAAGHGRGADRIEAEADVGRRRVDAAMFDQGGDQRAGVLRLRAQIEIERDAGIEMHVREHARDRRFRRVEPVAIGADRTGEHQRKPGRAVLQIVQRLGVGGCRIGMIDALHDRPGRARGASGDRHRASRAGVERVDRETVIGLGDEPSLERRALEHAVDQLAPLLLRGRRKFGSQRKVVWGVGHGHNMHPIVLSCKWRANRRGVGQRGGSFSMPAGSTRPTRRAMRFARNDTVGRDLRQGTSTKARSNSRGCGSVKSGRVEREIVVGENVDVERARSPAALLRAIAAECPLDGLRARQQVRAVRALSRPRCTD